MVMFNLNFSENSMALFKYTIIYIWQQNDKKNKVENKVKAKNIKLGKVIEMEMNCNILLRIIYLAWYNLYTLLVLQNTLKIAFSNPMEKLYKSICIFF